MFVSFFFSRDSGSDDSATATGLMLLPPMTMTMTMMIIITHPRVPTHERCKLCSSIQSSSSSSDRSLLARGHKHTRDADDIDRMIDDDDARPRLNRRLAGWLAAARQRNSLDSIEFISLREARRAPRNNCAGCARSSLMLTTCLQVNSTRAAAHLSVKVKPAKAHTRVLV